MPRRLGRFRSVINLLSEKHEFVPLLRSFAIFAPQSTLMVYFLFYQSFVARKYASAKLHMIEFVARLSNGSTASTAASTASTAASAGASAASAGASAASAGASAASAPLIPIQWIRALAETQLKQLLLNNVKDSYACEQLLSILSHFDEEYVLLHTTYKVSQQMCLLQHNDHAPPHQAAPHRLMASSIDLFVSPSDVVSQLLRRHMFQEARTYATTMYNKKTNLTKRILSQDQVHRVTMCEINDTLSRFQRVSFMISI
jgi:hypothetical protein